MQCGNGLMPPCNNSVQLASLRKIHKCYSVSVDRQRIMDCVTCMCALYISDAGLERQPNYTETNYLGTSPSIEPKTTLIGSDKQASGQNALQSLREQKASDDQQHKMELNALSSNLATVRRQLEEGKRRVQEAEAAAREKASKVEGEYIVYLVVW